jgi:glycosyltransferase involved in cell wall biosynthesis
MNRARQAWRVLRKEGSTRLAQRVSRVAYQRLRAAELDFPLHLEHVADSRDLKLEVPDRRPGYGTPLTLGWVCTPPGPGSGGHTTMFRMVEAAEAAGHTCVLYLYDTFGGDLGRQAQMIRQYWPRVKAAVRSVDDGLVPMDAYVASAWPTAHVLASAPALPTRRLYLVQDFEPYFYPRGSEYVLAEDTYRFGFRCIAVGRMVAGLLSAEFGITADVAEYGCDLSVYHLTNDGPRSGVVFYAKPETPRRGYTLAVLALREFHRHHPDQEIHLFGDTSIAVPFPATKHGNLTPAKLNDLYNRCRAGLAMSFTNVSLVPAEMLASGLIPVLSGGPEARADLDNRYVRWAPPTPRGLAEALGEAVRSDLPTVAEIATSVTSDGWAPGQRVTIAAIEDEVYGCPGDAS